VRQLLRATRVLRLGVIDDIDYVLLTSTTHQSSLFYFAFDREAALIKDDLLEPIDRLLEDLIELLRWRGGVEPRIANLKHRFGMERAHYKGDAGFSRFVGWTVIGQNLVSMARAETRREAKQSAVAKTQAA
jgi:hypothetical protein